MNIAQQAQFPPPIFAGGYSPCACKNIPFSFTRNRAKNRAFEANSAPVLHKNSLFEAKTPQKLQKNSRSSNFFNPPNLPNYSIYSTIYTDFARKNPEKVRVMVNLPNFPHKTRTKTLLFPFPLDFRPRLFYAPMASALQLKKDSES